MNGIKFYSYPNSNSVKIFKESDFALETQDKICIYEKECFIILFYNESPQAYKSIKTFEKVSQYIPKPYFGTCHIENEKGISLALSEIHSNKSHPFHWMTIMKDSAENYKNRPIPLIVVYRNGYPVNFYEGPMEDDRDTEIILTKFALSIATADNFTSFNTNFNTSIRNQMWSDYIYRNPNKFSINTLKMEDIPAVPFNEDKTF
jgi:hypothetical protein